MFLEATTARARSTPTAAPSTFTSSSSGSADTATFFPVKLESLSELEAAKALLAEAQHFKLKRLAGRVKEAIVQAKPSRNQMLWPLRGASDGDCMTFPRDHLEFPKAVTGTAARMDESMLYAVNSDLRTCAFSDLQIRRARLSALLSLYH